MRQTGHFHAHTQLTPDKQTSTADSIRTPHTPTSEPGAVSALLVVDNFVFVEIDV
jgi:hypothetical protein